jgi:hypothetical protein
MGVLPGFVFDGVSLEEEGVNVVVFMDFFVNAIFI